MAFAGKIFSTVPFEKEYSEQLMKLVKAGDIEEAKYILYKHGKNLVYDFDNVSAQFLYNKISIALPNSFALGS